MSSYHLSKRSLSLAGHRTSIALEPEFWTYLDSFAAQDGTSFAGLVARLDEARGVHPLASALRLYVLHRVATGKTSFPEVSSQQTQV